MSTLYSHIERNRQAKMYDEQQTVFIKKHVKYSLWNVLYTVDALQDQDGITVQI